MNLNKVIIVGRTTKKPELKKTQAGQSVTSFSLATSLTYTDKAGAKKEDTEFHNVVFWGKSAEIICQYVEKGSLLLIEGRLRTRSWEDKNGGKRYTTEIMGEKFQFGPKPAGKTNTAPVDEQPPANDDIPF